MSKRAFYFPHDYGARNDPKLQKVLSLQKNEGIGVFWGLIEMLYENEGELLLSECESYAFALRTDCDTIKKLLSDYDLFSNNGEKFWSESVNRRLKIQKDKSKKASKSAKIRWLTGDANALRTQSERNAIKEIKVKEKKREEITKESDVDFAAARLLFDQISFRNPKQKEPNFSDWAKHIRLLREQDGRTLEEIERVIVWCQADPFWQNNILSTAKLRDKFNQLFLKMNSKGEKYARPATIAEIATSTDIVGISLEQIEADHRRRNGIGSAR